jgi:hypothetical protein
MKSLARLWIIISLGCALSLGSASIVLADVFRLKNGETMEGEVVERSPTHTQIRVPYGTLSLRNEDILEITSGDIPETTSSVSSPAEQPQAILPQKQFPTPQEPLSIPAPEPPKGPVLFAPSSNITLTEIEKRAVLYFWEQSLKQA